MPTIQEWERDEVRRSALDAANRTDNLIANPSNIARYVNPRADTAYPLEYAFRLVGNIRGKRVLDFGCGGGENTVLLAAKGANVTGIDISPELVAIANDRLRVNQLPGNAVIDSCHRTGFQDETFDVVFGAAILHHLDLKLAHAEVFRILKPGGIAVFEEPMRDSRLLCVARSMIPYRSKLASKNERSLTTVELRTFASGFLEEEWRKYMLPHVLLIWHLLPSYLHEAFLADSWLLRKMQFLHNWTSEVVIALRKPGGEASGRR